MAPPEKSENQQQTSIVPQGQQVIRGKGPLSLEMGPSGQTPFFTPSPPQGLTSPPWLLVCDPGSWPYSMFSWTTINLLFFNTHPKDLSVQPGAIPLPPQAPVAGFLVRAIYLKKPPPLLTSWIITCENDSEFTTPSRGATRAHTAASQPGFVSLEIQNSSCSGPSRLLGMTWVSCSNLFF